MASDPKDLVAEADLYYDQGLMEEALGLYRDLIETHRKTPGAEDVIRHARARAESIEESLEPAPVQVTDKKERDAQTVFSEGCALMDVGELVLALERFQEAMDKGYEPVECLDKSVDALQALGRYSEAVDAANRLVALETLSDEQKTVYEEKLAGVLRAAGQGEQALKVYQRLIDEGRASDEIPRKVEDTRAEIRRHHINTARLYLKKERPSLAAMELARIEEQTDEVFSLFEEVVAKQPGNRQALEALARYHEEREEYKRAADRLRELTRLGDQSEEVVTKLRELYNTLAEHPEHGWEARYELANLKIATGDSGEGSQELLDIALEDNPFKLKSLLKVSDMMLKRGEAKEAVELMEGESEAVQRSVSPEDAALFWQELARAKAAASGAEVPAAEVPAEVEVEREPDAIMIEEPLVSRGGELLGLNLPGDLTYKVLEVLGQGPAGAVFKVESSATGAVRAAKRLKEDIGSADDRLMFLKEYASFNLNMFSPNLIAVYDLAQAGDETFLVMEYAETSLARVLKEQGRLSLEEAVAVAKQVLQGLSYAHAHRGKDGVVRRVPHLGIKPTNILMGKGLTNLKLSDTGLSEHLAVHLNYSPPITEREEEELHYLTPEHYGLKVRRLTERASIAMDIYAFGTVFYHMLTGFPPFKGPTVEDFKNQHLTKYPVPPRVEVNTLPLGVDSLVLKCLEKQPRKRWRSATEVELALDKALLL